MNYNNLFLVTADPAVEFANPIVYALQGNTVQMTATIHSSDPEALVLLWFHEGRLIDTVSDPHYLLSSSGDVLNVVGVTSDDLGRYEVLARVGDRNDSAIIQLMFPGTCVNIEEYLWLCNDDVMMLQYVCNLK